MVGDGLPLVFALGAAKRTCVSFNISRAVVLEGILTAKVLSPAVTLFEIPLFSIAFNINVIGPGQNLSINIPTLSSA